jgi:hypothetical protein
MIVKDKIQEKVNPYRKVTIATKAEAKEKKKTKIK